MNLRAQERAWPRIASVLVLLGLCAGSQTAWARDSGRASDAAADAAQANKLLHDARTALQAGDTVAGHRLAAQSYRVSRAPDALFVLGEVALAEKNLIAAQDLLRRYLSDPNLEVGADSAELQAAQRIVERPRPPASQLSIIGDRGALVFVDDRLVGALPLVRPLLIVPGEHKVTLERRGARLEDIVRVAVGRLAELRVNLATKALVLTVLPGVLLRQSLPGLSAADHVGFDQTLEAGLTSKRLSALTERDSVECGEPAPGSCSDLLRCEVEQAKHCEADYVLRTRLDVQPGPPSGLQLTVDLIDVQVGAVAASDVLRCQGCVATALRERLRGTLSLLLERGIGRGRGSVDIASLPASAMVFVDGQAVGLTPYRGPLFAGGHQVLLRKEGFSEFSQPIDVRDGESTQILGSLQPNAPVAVATPAPIYVKQPGRPLWRLLTGGVAIGAGAVLFGFGISALSIDNKCVNALSTPTANCQTVYNTGEVGGALLGLSIGMMLGGSVVIALPPARPKAASSPSRTKTP